MQFSGERKKLIYIWWYLQHTRDFRAKFYSFGCVIFFSVSNKQLLCGFVFLDCTKVNPHFSRLFSIFRFVCCVCLLCFAWSETMIKSVVPCSWSIDCSQTGHLRLRRLPPPSVRPVAVEIDDKVLVAIRTEMKSDNLLILRFFSQFVVIGWKFFDFSTHSVGMMRIDNIFAMLIFWLSDSIWPSSVFS